jgi:hypothetical protein
VWRAAGPAAPSRIRSRFADQLACDVLPSAVQACRDRRLAGAQRVGGFSVGQAEQVDRDHCVSVGSGRREINWDGVPDAFAAPNNLPLDFFNHNSPRGVIFSTPGRAVQVSANAGVAPIEFDNLNPTYSSLFRPFSPQRLFTAIRSNKVTVRFFVPGSSTPATTSGFGAVFTDVDRPGTEIAYYDAHGRRLAEFDVPVSPGNETLSFLGVRFLHAGVAKVRITSGTAIPGQNETDRRDVVAMDDFIYGEPGA